jgi:hypothetical protein
MCADLEAWQAALSPHGLICAVFHHLLVSLQACMRRQDPTPGVSCTQDMHRWVRSTATVFLTVVHNYCKVWWQHRGVVCNRSTWLCSPATWARTAGGVCSQPRWEKGKDRGGMFTGLVGRLARPSGPPEEHHYRVRTAITGC